MRLFTLITLVCLLSFATGCTTSGNDIASPPMPELGQSNDFSNTPEGVLECRANMRAIASQAIIYYASNERYPKTLEEIGMAGVVCTECNMEYMLTGDADIFNIECPLPTDPNHGCIDDGVASWLMEPGQGENACRANMRTIASQCAIFFAGNDRYPESLQEIGMEDVVCGDCGLPYEYTGGERRCIRLECPLPADPNHGNIDNGVASWIGSTTEE